MFLKKLWQHTRFRVNTRDKIYCNIIEGLAPDNDEYHLQDKPDSLTVKINLKDRREVIY